MAARKSHGFVFLSAVLVAGLAGCGGGSTSPTVVATPAPLPCSHTTLLQGGAALPANTADFESITTTATGRLDLTLDWTFPTSLMGMAVSRGPCDLDQLKAGACELLVQQVSPPKPLKGSIANLAPGTYGLLILNANSVPESVSVSAVLSSSTCPAAASSFAAESAVRDSEIFPRILRGLRGSLGRP